MRHRSRGMAYRAAWVVAGFLLVVAGFALFVLPGPGVLVVAVGLTMLSFEFIWAARALDHAAERAERMREAAQRASRTRRLVAVALALAVVATAAAVAVAWWRLR